MGVSRLDMLRSLGLIKTVDAVLRRQYEKEEEAYWAQQADETERSATWDLSFHASSFPIDDLACPRQALYGLMSIPDPTPRSRFLRAVMEAGIDIDARIVKRFHDAGVLISGHGDNQTNFRFRSHWLVGHTDAIIVLPGTNRPHVVEIKSKKDAHVDEMIAGSRGYDRKHYGQIQTYIAGARYGHERLFASMGLEPCCDGTILYISRDDPSKTFEFFVEFDEVNFKQGLDKLAEWREAFTQGRLLSRPSGYMWSKEPCQWCAMKKLCKQDDKDGITLIKDSCAIDFAKQHDPQYDIAKIWQAVQDHWR